MTEDGMAAYEETNQDRQRLACSRIAKGVEPDCPVHALIHREGTDGERLPIETRAPHFMLVLTGSTETFPRAFANLIDRLAGDQHNALRLPTTDIHFDNRGPTG